MRTSPEQTDTSITVPANYWSYDPFGNLTTIGGINGTAGQVPISVDPGFKVPHTLNYHVGVQRQLASDMVLTFDYYHKDIEDITTVRATNQLLRRAWTVSQMNSFPEPAPSALKVTDLGSRDL